MRFVTGTEAFIYVFADTDAARSAEAVASEEIMVYEMIYTMNSIRIQEVESIHSNIEQTVNFSVDVI